MFIRWTSRLFRPGCNRDGDVVKNPDNLEQHNDWQLHSSTNTIIIHHPDLDEVEHITVEYPLVYTKERDYYKSVLNVLHRKGIVIDKSIEIIVTSTIPINAGCSSSSALIVCFITFLKKLLELDFSNSAIAEIAYAAGILTHWFTPSFIH